MQSSNNIIENLQNADKRYFEISLLEFCIKKIVKKNLKAVFETGLYFVPFLSQN